MDELKRRIDGIVAALRNVDEVGNDAIDLDCYIDDIKHVDARITRDVQQLEALTKEYRSARGAYLACGDDDMRDRLRYAAEDRAHDLDTYEIRYWLRQLVYDIDHQITPTKTQLQVFEVMDEDGEVAVSIPDGDRTIVSYGWTAQDVYELLALATEYDPKEILAHLERLG